VDAAWSAYNEAIDAIARDVRTAVVDPYFQRYGVEFLNGMGTYYLERHGETLDPEDLAMWVRNLLDLEIPGMPADSLGTIM
jgi:hypothetical protein